MTISVVVPIYNMERYLKRCIDSILGQTILPHEIILVDDGSSDSSLSICDEYKRRTGLVRVIHQDNQGVSIARNTGLDAVTGDYVCFIDPDDWVDPEYLSALLAHQSGSDLVVGGYKVVGVENYIPGNRTFFAFAEYSKEEFFRNFSRFRNDNALSSILSSPINKLYRVDIIRSHSLRFDPSISLGEDYLFNLGYFVLCEKIVVISDALYNYLIRPDSLSRGMSYKTAISQIRLYDETVTFVNKFIKPITGKVNIVGFKVFLFNHVILSCYRTHFLTKKEMREILLAVKRRFSLKDFFDATGIGFLHLFFAFLTFIFHPSVILTLLSIRKRRA